MKIQKILSQYRRDFMAIYECEHCGACVQRGGYDDERFHRVVIPGMFCERCGKKSGADYQPRTPKYPEGMQV